MQMALQFIQRHRILAVLALCIVSLSVWAGYRYWHRLAHYSGTSRIAIDMRKPSMVLRTQNLAELPQDIAQMPLLTGWRIGTPMPVMSSSTRKGIEPPADTQEPGWMDKSIKACELRRRKLSRAYA
jgi:hypothetical protein